MIQQEAIKFLEETKEGCNFTIDKQLLDVCNIAISAIEKQIPKKVEHLEDYPTDRDCPNCFSNLASYDKTIQHCPYCGQALDWSDNNA